MAGFMDILGTMMKQGMSQSGGSRMSNALGGGQGGNSLNDILGSLTNMMGSGSTGKASASTGAGGLGDMLGGVLGSLANNKAALGGLGALAGALMGGGKSASRGAVGGGGLAMLASLAFSALQKAGQKPSQMPRALMEAQTPQEKKALEDDAETIVKAMINAAKADNKIDQKEIEKIVGKLDDDGLSQEEKDFFMTEANKPIDTAGIIASAGGQAEMAAQIYAASLLAIEVDTKAEQDYMQQLASGLGLHPQVVSHIESTLGV